MGETRLRRGGTASGGAGARCAVSRETATMVAGGGAQWESASPGAPPVRPCGVGGAATARPRGTSVETSWSRLEHAIATRINDRTSRQGIQLPCTKNRIRAPLRWKWRPRGPPGLSDVAYRSYTASRPTRELSAAHADASRGLSCAAHARGPHRVRGEQVRRSRSRDVSKITHGFCHNHFTPHTTSCDTMVGTRCVGRVTILPSPQCPLTLVRVARRPFAPLPARLAGRM